MGDHFINPTSDFGVSVNARSLVDVRRLMLALILGTVIACGAPESAQILEPAAFEKTIDDRVLVNVHVPFEGALPGTDLEIPFDQIEQQRSLLPADPSTPIAIYCMSGNMSADAMTTLHELGYTDVVDLAGGMQAWEASGRPIVTERPS
jgi:phage shock protein E